MNYAIEFTIKKGTALLAYKDATDAPFSYHYHFFPSLFLLSARFHGRSGGGWRTVFRRFPVQAFQAKGEGLSARAHHLFQSRRTPLRRRVDAVRQRLLRRCDRALSLRQ